MCTCRYAYVRDTVSASSGYVDGKSGRPDVGHPGFWYTTELAFSPSGEEVTDTLQPIGERYWARLHVRPFHTKLSLLVTHVVG